MSVRLSLKRPDEMMKMNRIAACLIRSQQEWGSVGIEFGVSNGGVGRSAEIAKFDVTDVNVRAADKHRMTPYATRVLRAEHNASG